jgi:Rrf2 family iron-sulfur cluster assembly transcriptional regulator
MVDLAQHGDNDPVSRRDIAERQEISADYVAQLFGHLQSAGLVQGVKGPGGGYRLVGDAALISAADVVQAVEGPVAVVRCTLPDPGEGPACNRVDRCVTHLLWKRLSKVVVDLLDSVSLEDLCAQAQELAEREGQNCGENL